MTQGAVRLVKDGPVAWITIENLSKHNAMSLAMWRALGSVLDELTDDARCVVVRGAGQKAFVSGADIAEFADQRRSPEDVATYDDSAESAMAKLHGLAIPTVAMIGGYCLGGGVALALCCDVRIAADTAVFAVPAARLGLGYGWKGVDKLLHAVSVPVALDIMMSARRFDARSALTVGLINQVHAAADLERGVTQYAAMIASNAPLTVHALKRTIRELSERAPPDLALCDRLVAECFASDDYIEGARAFLEKRSPRFRGR